jgi:hypothetical protein
VNFCQWSFLESWSSENNLRTTNQLKINTERATGNIEEVTLRNVARNMIAGVQRYTEEAGHHFPTFNAKCFRILSLFSLLSYFEKIE